MFSRVSVSHSIHREGFPIPCHLSYDACDDIPPSPQGHENAYGWQASGMHPTGMLSCSMLLKHFEKCVLSFKSLRSETAFYLYSKCHWTYKHI